MPTVTMRHQVGPDLRPQLRGLMAAWRRTRQGGAVQALWSEKVEASVRATETTHSRANGWHPHSHVLLHGSNWTRSERQVLFNRWRRVVVDELGTVATPTAEHGLHWTPWFDASSAPTAYLTKVGLELSGAGKEGRWGSALRLGHRGGSGSRRRGRRAAVARLCRRDQGHAGDPPRRSRRGARSPVARGPAARGRQVQRRAARGARGPAADARGGAGSGTRSTRSALASACTRPSSRTSCARQRRPETRRRPSA